MKEILLGKQSLLRIEEVFKCCMFEFSMERKRIFIVRGRGGNSQEPTYQKVKADLSGEFDVNILDMPDSEI